ncbi:MAG: hypothetical protein R2798_14340 [Chitinophagales bacterium]|nr:hypothetical protein [Bacteroidota bacterium]MCB9043468.1 hypothetical protein [Chitinophagales bacterium]
MTQNEFKQNAQAQLNELSSSFDQLGDQVNLLKAKAGYYRSLADLEESKISLQKQYNDLENAADDKWEDFKSAFQNAADSLQSKFDDFKNSLD